MPVAFVKLSYLKLILNFMKWLCQLMLTFYLQQVLIGCQEYEDQSTAESKFVKDLDRFDMILQAFEYETAECRPSTDLEEFFTSCEGVVFYYC